MVFILCAQLHVQFYTDQFETLQTLLTWSADVHVVLASSSIYFFFFLLFLTFEWGGGVCKGFVYFTSPGHPTHIGVQLGKARYSCGR